MLAYSAVSVMTGDRWKILWEQNGVFRVKKCLIVTDGDWRREFKAKQRAMNSVSDDMLTSDRIYVRLCCQGTFMNSS